MRTILALLVVFAGLAVLGVMLGNALTEPAYGGPLPTVESVTAD